MLQHRWLAYARVFRIRIVEKFHNFTGYLATISKQNDSAWRFSEQPHLLQCDDKREDAAPFYDNWCSRKYTRRDRRVWPTYVRPHDRGNYKQPPWRTQYPSSTGSFYSIFGACIVLCKAFRFRDFRVTVLTLWKPCFTHGMCIQVSHQSFSVDQPV